nr:ribonuclease H-like domain-containing protein [Tanacetum cinerariifolium]
MPTPSHDLLPSDEDRLKLNELMEIYTKLSERVLSLEQIKTNQASKIEKLKKRVNKVKCKKKKRTYGLKRLYKVGLSARIVSSDEEGLGDQEDASKRWRSIADIYQDKGTTLVDDPQRRMNEEDLFRLHDLDVDEVFGDVSAGKKEEQSENVAKKEVITTDLVIFAGEVVTIADVEFYQMEGIKREFSVAKTPQQNGVAKRKNRTLIEAAKTMLADSLLPTIFLAEAVNIACYVQNRVLVIKPHNKTPYKLLLGGSSNIDFMKPFRCHVTILNTLDHVVKFKGNADEGSWLDTFLNINTVGPNDPSMPSLEETGIFDDAYDDKEMEPKKALQALADLSWIEAMQEELLQFKLQKDLDSGELTFFLRLQVKQKDDGIFISQNKYVADILKKFDYTTMKTASTLIEPNKALIKDAKVEDRECLIWYGDGLSKDLELKYDGIHVNAVILPYYWVLSLEQIKTNQAAKIEKLKKSVNKVECKKKKRTHGLKRLYKVSLSARIFSSDEEGLGDQEGTCKHVRSIADIYQDKGTTLVDDTQRRMNEEDLFRLHDLDGDEDVQAKVSDDDTTELKRCLKIVLKDDDDVAIEATPLSSKSPTIVDYKIYREGKKNYFRIITTDGNSQNYLTFRKMFKNFNREDLEVLRSIVKERFKKTKPVDDMDNLLFQTLKIMFEHHIKDNIWKYQQGVVKVHNWKLFDFVGVYCVTTKIMVYYLLVEKMYLDSGCSKHMIGDRSQLTDFNNKFLGTVMIPRVYYVEALGHNLFSIGKFCDLNLDVAFRQHTCYICNLEGVDLLNVSRGNTLYTLSFEDMMASSPICLLSKASKTKSWLWHQRLSHLNFGAINYFARHCLVRGLLKLKFVKDHL